MVFTARAGKVWRIGDFDNPDFSFNGVDEAGVEWLLPDPVGWHRTAPVELGLEDKPRDGAWFGRGAFRSRVLECRGVFRACRGGIQTLDDAGERLRDLFDPGTSTLLSVTEAVPKQLTVRPSAEVIADPAAGQVRARRFSFVLTAADPFKYAAGAAGLVEAGFALADPAGLSGYTYPLDHPMTTAGGGAGISTWQQTVVNIGRLPAVPTVRFIGPAVRPALTNVTTGDRFVLNRTLPAGVEAVVNVGVRSITIGGSSDYAAGSGTGSTFWALAAGPNDVRFTADAYAAGLAYLRWRPRWK
jgi:hypothetical protein